MLLQLLVVLVLVLAALALATLDARSDTRARSRGPQPWRWPSRWPTPPSCSEALATPSPAPTLQPYAEQVRADTGVDFVVVMALDRTRYTHPDPSQIGKPFIGDLGSAPEGRVFTQEYTGTLGRSIRAVTPVLNDGRVVALVSVGITLDRIDEQLRDDLPPILLAALGALAVGALGAWLISRRLRRQTHGMGAREITRMYEYYRAVLHAVREGMLLVDEHGVVQLVNDEARRLLSLRDEVAGRSLGELGLPPGLVHAAASATAESDQLYVLGEHVLLISSAPAQWSGRGVGAVITLRDRTQLQEVTGQLDQVRALTESLRSQNHEAANRLHTVVRSSRWAAARRRSTSPPRSSRRPVPRRPGRGSGARACPRRPAPRQERRGGRARHRAGHRRRDGDIDELAVPRARPGHRRRQPRGQRHGCRPGEHADGRRDRAGQRARRRGCRRSRRGGGGQRPRRTARGRGPRPRTRLVDQGLRRPRARARPGRPGGPAHGGSIDVGSSPSVAARFHVPSRGDREVPS